MSVIEFKNITKTYQLGSKTSFREAITNLFTGMLQKDENSRGYINSLDDVSFTVDEGEVLGIIGANGAGKTTTLKLLSKVTFPTSGKIRVDGRISALIELGAGFHPDLTGKENIYLNGSILGLRSSEIDKKFDQIVNFSGLERFLDTPVKRYSSGMYARLAFSIAAHVDPDVLLVDEVLSVGDAVFQEKCFTRMKEIREMGRAMVFVSHNTVAVQNICSRVMWLQEGKVKKIGEPSEVISSYLSSQYSQKQDLFKMEEGEELFNYSEGVVEVNEIKILNGDGKEFDTIRSASKIMVSIKMELKRSLDSLVVRLYMTDKLQNRLMGSNFIKDSPDSLHQIFDGDHTLLCTFDAAPAKPNIYYFNIDILENEKLLYRKMEIGPIIVWMEGEATIPDQYKNFDLFNIPSTWKIINSK